MTLHKNQVITLTIQTLSNDGNGIGRYNGQVIFVANSAPQDELEVKIIKSTKNYCVGRIEEILKPSPVRIPSSCPVSNQCGGCCFRHISYTAELQAKQQFVKDALQRIGNIDIEPLPILASPKEDRYRNKVQYALENKTDDLGKMNLYHGFYAPHSHRVIPVSDCLLQPEIANNIANKCAELLEQFNVAAYTDETANKEVIKSIYIRESNTYSTFMVCLVCGQKPISCADKIAQILVNTFPQISTILLNCNDKKGNTLLGKTTYTLIGNGTIDEILCDVPINIGLHSFFQVNYAGAQVLFSIVKTFSNPNKDDILVDLYCGAGIIGLSMAKQVKQLIGVEIVEPAIQSAKESAQKLDLKNVQFYCEDAQIASQTFVKNNISPTIVTIDPPRKGCSADTIAATIQMAPKKIVMVSCNPATLARDLKILTNSNYKIQHIQPVDMFPRTKHVETVVLLQRQ